MTREEMIELILDEVNSWDEDTLIDWVQLEMLIRLKDMSNEEVEDNYWFLFGEEE